MNERIKELAREAGLLAHNPEGVPTKLETFAELIINDCIAQLTIVHESGVPAQIQAGLNLGRVSIKEHFEGETEKYISKMKMKKSEFIEDNKKYWGPEFAEIAGVEYKSEHDTIAAIGCQTMLLLIADTFRNGEFKTEIEELFRL